MFAFFAEEDGVVGESIADDARKPHFPNATRDKSDDAEHSPGKVSPKNNQTNGI